MIPNGGSSGHRKSNARRNRRSATGDALQLLLKVDMEGVPTASTLPDEVRQALWALVLARRGGQAMDLSAVEISYLLQEKAGVYLHWRTIEATLRKRKDLAFRRLNNGTARYKITDAGQQFVEGATDSIYLVDPSKAYDETTRLHDLLGQLAGDVRLCDPYADRTALDHLSAIPQSCRIRWLSKHVQAGGGFRQEVATFGKQYAPLTVRILGAGLHDRYVIDDHGMLILGTSLNGFGKSQAFVVAAGMDLRDAVSAVFDVNWAAATPLA